MEAKRAEKIKREFESECKREREREKRRVEGEETKGDIKEKVWLSVTCLIFMFHACQTVCLSASCLLLQ